MKYQYAHSMLRLFYGNDIVINTYEILVYSQHVKVVAWRLYHLHNFKLRAWYNTLLNRDCEHGVLHYRNYRSQFCFLTSFAYLWISFLCISLDIAFWVSFHVRISLAFMGFTNSQSFTICHSFLIFNWDPHACCGQDMIFYNCYTLKQILIIVLNKMPTF